jgi:hypothetical protein
MAAPLWREAEHNMSEDPIDVLNDAARLDFEHVVVVGIDRDGMPEILSSTTRTYAESILHAAWRMAREASPLPATSDATH